MKILFIMRHSGYVRNFESTLRMLCERGHQVHLAFQAKMRHWLLDSTDIGKQLSEDYATFSQGTAPVREDGWGLLGREVRRSLDYLRYLNPEYRDAPKLRRRVERDVANVAVRMARRGPITRRSLAHVLRLMDHGIPRSPEIDRFIDEQQPDLLLLTPLIEPGSPQTDYQRSARARGVRTVFCVASWDNLTNKGLIRDPLDLVTVWNEEMKREAVELHRVPPERIAVTGAQPFDHWFGWQPSTSRGAFCQRVGLSADQPYLLYLCSSKFVAPDEAPFVRKWVNQLRESSSPTLQNAGVLVRPHPQNADQWRRFDACGLSNFAVYPPIGAAPVDASSRSDYFDSMHHSAAVVGVNTTAEIESAIVGRPVYTLLAPEFEETQEGTLHFHHLTRVNGGLLSVAEDFPDHLAQLDAALRNERGADGRCRKFVEAFVRPHGIDVPATPKLVEALEALGTGPAPDLVPAPIWAPLSRRLLTPLAARLHREAKAAAQAKAVRRAAKKATARAKAKASAARKMKTGARATMLEPGKPCMGIAAAGSETAGPGRAPAGDNRIGAKALARAFRRLDPRDRARFIRRVAQEIPPDTWLEVRTAKAEQLDFSDARIDMRVTTKSEKVRLRACAKEPWTVNWIVQTIRAGEVLYDIGANVGAYSLVAAKKPNGGARVFAFEPSYATVEALCANVVMNDLAERVTPLPVALSDKNALDTFNLVGLAPGNARHQLGEGESEEGATLYPQPILTFRLDDLIARYRLPPPNHIKLDVDGGELALLRGATKTLASPLLLTVLVEVTASLSDQVIALFERGGMYLHSKIDVKNKAGEYRVWYGLFARNGSDAASRCVPLSREPSGTDGA